MAICEGEPMNQDQLWYTIGTLADHPTNQWAGVYNRSPGWPSQRTRVGWGIHKEPWLTSQTKQSQLGYTIRALTDHSNEPGSWSIFFVSWPKLIEQTIYVAKNLKKLKRKQKNQKRHPRSQISKKATMHFLFLFPCSNFFITWLNSIGQIAQQTKINWN